MDGNIFERPNGNPQSLSHFFELLLDGTPKGIGISVEKNCLSGGLDSQPLEFGQRLALAKNQAGTDRAEVCIQGTQTPTEEVLAIRSGPTVGILPTAEHIDRGHMLRGD